jgi:hypothetical protein
VNLVEIDVVSIQPREAVFDCAHDVSARQADGIGSGPHSSPHLGSDDHIVSRDAEILDGVAQDPLRLAFGVNIGRVEEINAGIGGETQQIIRGRLIELSDEGHSSPRPPKVIVPRQISETNKPLYFIAAYLVLGC